MGRILFYGSGAVILAIALWFYSQGEKAPDAFIPGIVFLFALMSFGYGEKAKEDGDFGAGSGRIHRDKNPQGFQYALYINYLITGGLIVLGVYLLL